MRLAKPADCENLRLVTFVVILLGHQRDFTIVIAEADPHQAIMRDPLVKAKHVKIPLVDAALGEFSMKTGDQALVFWTNGANVNLTAILKTPRFDILNRIRANGRQRRLDDILRLQDDSGIQR